MSDIIHCKSDRDQGQDQGRDWAQDHRSLDRRSKDPDFRNTDLVDCRCSIYYQDTVHNNQSREHHIQNTHLDKISRNHRLPAQ